MGLVVDFVAMKSDSGRALRAPSRNRQLLTADNDRQQTTATFSPNEHSTRRLHQLSTEHGPKLKVLYDAEHESPIREHFFHQPPMARSKSAHQLHPFSPNRDGRRVLWSWTWHTLTKVPRNNVDHLVGVALAVYLYTCSEGAISWAIKVYETCLTHTMIRDNIAWLMGYPAGLKLNNHLDRFLGEMFLWLLHQWSAHVDIRAMIFYAFWATTVAFFGYGGTLGISVALDALRLGTVHILAMHRIARRLYAWELRTLMSLFHLFRGRKWNVLRGRLDRHDYDLDQLLLGTVLFTLLFFAFPTVIVYYVLFSLISRTLLALDIVLTLALSSLLALRPMEVDLQERPQFRVDIVDESTVRLVALTNSHRGGQQSPWWAKFQFVAGNLDIPRSLKQVVDLRSFLAANL
jgi:hypothetical protein